MKSNFLKIFMLALLPAIVASCVPNTPEVETLPTDPVSFEYRIKGDYSLDYYIDSYITFLNTSPTTGEAVWDFGDGKSATGNEVEHAYDEAGTYNVTLTINGLTKNQVIMISDIKPLLSLNPIEGGVCEVLSTPVSFSLEIPNPKNRELTYNWIFPARTKNVTGEVMESCTDSLPGEVIFGNVGSQTVRLQVTMDGRLLEEGVLNVPVGYNKEVPTLYYAEVGGHLMAYKIVSDSLTDMDIMPYDLGLSSGQHPFNLLFKDSSLYVLDAGAGWYYQNEDAQLNGGDGKISVISKDGSKVETMLSNAGGPAFQDPFYGCIIDNDLYFTDRNTGIIKVPLSTRNAVYSASEFPYFVQHNTLGYYGGTPYSWSYGCIGGTVGQINGVWYWAKNYNGNGIFRWKNSDISLTSITNGTSPDAGCALFGMSPKSYAYSTKSNKICFTILDGNYEGFYVCTLAQLDEIGTSKNALAPYKKLYNETLGFIPNKSGGVYAAKEGHTSEFAAICQIAYDEVNDCAYFAYRNNLNDVECAPTGIYKYDFEADKIEQVLTGKEVYGLVVNNTPSKLF